MATSVSNTEKLTLLNGVEVELRPLAIFSLRKFMQKFDEISHLEGDDITEINIMDIMVESSAIALSKHFEAETAFINIEDKDSEEYQSSRKAYEELVDMAMVNKINEICGGVKMQDPNLEAPLPGPGGRN